MLELNTDNHLHIDCKNCTQQRIKIIGQLVLNPMVKALLRGRQIFKFGLLNKKIIRKI
jgi:hypothetical protein